MSDLYSNTACRDCGEHYLPCLCEAEAWYDSERENDGLNFADLCTTDDDLLDGQSFGEMVRTGLPGGVSANTQIHDPDADSMLTWESSW